MMAPKLLLCLTALMLRLAQSGAPSPQDARAPDTLDAGTQFATDTGSPAPTAEPKQGAQVPPG